MRIEFSGGDVPGGILRETEFAKRNFDWGDFSCRARTISWHYLKRSEIKFKKNILSTESKEQR